MYDVIVVGARCAGSPTASLLARRGYRVLLVDRSTFPSDTLSSHYLLFSGAARLKRWGLLDEVARSNCPAISHYTFDFGALTLTGSPAPAGDLSHTYAPRRTVLDKILVDAAVRAGVELREAFSVQEILMEGDRVTGIRGRSAGGSTVTEEAHITIGADGLHSLVARTVQAPKYNAKPTLTCTYYTYWDGVPIDGAELYPRDNRVVIAFPTNDGLVLTYMSWPASEFQTFRANIEGNFLQTLDLAPGLAERIRQGKRAERFAGTADLPNFFRRPYGPGWALVGDAGYHKDPYLAQGISDAFRDAELLAEAVDAGLAGRQPLDEALADYERQRNLAAMPHYELDCQLASLEPPPPEMQQLLTVLSGNPTETTRFLGSLQGTVPIPEFFSPENIGRILASAVA